jgi:hypothetical protein
MASPVKKHPATTTISDASVKFEAEVSNLYCETNLEESGLRREVFAYAYKGYLKLLEEHKISRSNIITICDLRQSSRNLRLYVVDMENRKKLIKTYVPIDGLAVNLPVFSNRWSSHKSSLAFM